MDYDVNEASLRLHAQYDTTVDLLDHAVSSYRNRLKDPMKSPLRGLLGLVKMGTDFNQGSVDGLNGVVGISEENARLLAGPTIVAEYQYAVANHDRAVAEARADLQEHFASYYSQARYDMNAANSGTTTNQ